MTNYMIPAKTAVFPIHAITVPESEWEKKRMTSHRLLNFAKETIIPWYFNSDDVIHMDETWFYVKLESACVLQEEDKKISTYWKNAKRNIVSIKRAELCNAFMVGKSDVIINP